MDNRAELIEKIFEAQDSKGLWKTLSPSDHYYPDYQHYVPNFKASLWTLILLADLQVDKNEVRLRKALTDIKDQFYDADHGIFTLKEDHFPIPCLNGNIVYLDAYFNKTPDPRCLKALDFFAQYQRFDDGCYVEPKNKLCTNTSCYGKHSCYWGIVKLLKGISFVPTPFRSQNVEVLKQKCVDFILRHEVCFSSHHPERIMIEKLDLLTFPNMYKSDFLEILWLLKREKVHSEAMDKALRLLQSKKQHNGSWQLEREIKNMVVSIGKKNASNAFITQRALEVIHE